MGEPRLRTRLEPRGRADRVLQGRKIEELLGREVFERFLPHYQRVLGGETVEYEGPSGIGIDPNRWIHATYTPIWNDDPLPVGWVAVISDEWVIECILRSGLLPNVSLRLRSVVFGPPIGNHFWSALGCPV